VRRILFADSEPNIRLLCREELEDEGYEVQVAGSGGEIVRLVDTFKPHLVIMEVLLPDMSGLEAGRMVKGTTKNTRIIFFSHGRPPQDLAAWGGDAYVPKTPDLEPLKKTVRYFCELNSGSH